ncbi:MAG: 50S ribosomal protein L39e [Crenarchaeota archaeon]|nr:50S ribosomal protein L39e [Thermoproteota archaeon]
MAHYKHVARKLRLAKKTKQIRALPAWVILKTRRRVTRNPVVRHWRRQKIKNV